MNEPTVKELMDLINGGDENGKANCQIGLFLEEAVVGEDQTQAVDEFIVKKPVLNIAPLVHENDLFYKIDFLFNSYEDADCKQMWRFLCHFASRASRVRTQLETGIEVNKYPVLSVSILPDIYAGKYFALAKIIMEETITKEEEAFTKNTVISMVCAAEDLNFYIADDDVIDRRAIEEEVRAELAQEEAEAFPM